MGPETSDQSIFKSNALMTLQLLLSLFITDDIKKIFEGEKSQPRPKKCKSSSATLFPLAEFRSDPYKTEGSAVS